MDRRHRPGGHWLDAYPFVRLHGPSATYGVNSRVLGNDRIDMAGLNAGFYERATGPEICAYSTVCSTRTSFHRVASASSVCATTGAWTPKDITSCRSSPAPNDGEGPTQGR